MEVTLLGTGSADGWPNPWCECVNCRDQASRGSFRSPTSALIDDRLLLDAGPEAGRQALRAGTDLTGVKVVAISHAHHDHLDPAFLLYRGWLPDRAPLRVVGPAPAIAQCRDWLPDPPVGVELVSVTAGSTVSVAGYRIDALAADHEAFGEAVLYRITDRAGTSLLYATDTGPLPASTVAALSGSELDGVLLEETFGYWPDSGTRHLDLPGFSATLDRLRQVGAVGEATDVVAVHLSHHNPPLPDLESALAACGARCVPDGTRLQLGS